MALRESAVCRSLRRLVNRPFIVSNLSEAARSELRAFSLVR